jgi:two-component system, cell cycle sensor histidine kinase and response regulator CckA
VMKENSTDKDLKKLNAEYLQRSDTGPKEKDRNPLSEKEKDAKIKEAEKALDESERKYRTLFDMVSDALALIEIDTGQMLDVNKTFLKLYGYSREEVLGMKNTDFSAEPEKTKNATRTKGTYIPIRYHKKKDGTVFPTEISAGLFKYQGRDVHIAAIRDITERQRFEDLRQRSQKMEFMGLVAGGVAHDLNNVLSGIMSYPELLLLELAEDSKLRKPIMTMHKSGQRAAAIVEDLLTIARGVATAKEPMHVNALVNEYLDSPEYRKLRQFHPFVALHTHVDPDLFNILGSYMHIRKVVMNLVSNAAEAIDGMGNITVSTMNCYVDKPIKGYDDVKIGEYVVLSVSDDGPGISAEDIERIFEPFFTKKVMGRSGTGLGLSVVWNVVEDHHGYIDVKSSEKGTTFKVYLPITRDLLPDKKLTRTISEYKGTNETILVVDDMESQRELFCKMLDNLGYRPQAVSNGEAAVDYVKTKSVDLVLLDMIMDPGINGLETFKRILEIHPNQKAIIVSGFAETNDVKEAQRLGAGRYIKKPFSIEKIGMAIRDELKR